MRKSLLLLICLSLSSTVFGESNVELPDYKDQKIFRAHVISLYENLDHSMAYLQVGYIKRDNSIQGAYEFSIYSGPVKILEAKSLWTGPYDDFVSYVENNTDLAIYTDNKSRAGYLFKYSRNWFAPWLLELKLKKKWDIAFYKTIHDELGEIFFSEK